jgi:hypothetical protein
MTTPRLDGWFNVLTGLGTSRDKPAAGAFATVLTLSPQALEDLYHGDELIARICDLLVALCGGTVQPPLKTLRTLDDRWCVFLAASAESVDGHRLR